MFFLTKLARRLERIPFLPNLRPFLTLLVLFVPLNINLMKMAKLTHYSFGNTLFTHLVFIPAIYLLSYCSTATH